MRFTRTVLLAVLLAVLVSPPAQARPCGIAGEDPVGAADALSHPCFVASADGRDAASTGPFRRAVRLELAASDPAGANADAPERQVLLLTADDYAPFTDRALPEGGLITAIVDAAMERAAGVTDHRIDRVNDWASHLDPLLTIGAYDMGFPWLRPDCEGDPKQFRCASFLFSEPMFEMLVLLFVKTDAPLTFNEDDDIVGKTLCRPAGYYTHDLDKDGRNWHAESLVTLKQPDTVDDCFKLLLAGEVDAVAINEFTGLSAVQRLDLGEAVEAVRTRPLSIEGLYVLVNRNHPWARDLIDGINDGLARIKEDGTYREIVDRHLRAFWGQAE